MTLQPWEVKAQEARDLRDASLAKVDPPLGPLPYPLPRCSQDLPKKLLTPREYELTQNYDATELLALLRAKKVTAEELTRAFLRRAALAQYAVNCVTELMWDEAIARARYLDSLPEPMGPLHGLPISVKEHHGMEGKTAHASFVAWIGHPSETNPLNDYLYQAGCVYYVRTTGPQTLMQLECCNNIYGRTVNPWNRDLTSGGSSGGEGALVAFRGSVWGLGGDIGGSVRVPASNNGVYGFKPTANRLPLKGMKYNMHGRDSVLATYGPLTQSRDTIHLFMKVILDNEPWRLDPALTVKSWTPETLTQPLKVAIEWSDGVVQPHPPMLRALKMVADACAAAGMEVVDWEPYQHDRAWHILSGLYFPDGGEDTKGLLAESGEPVLPLTRFIIDEQPNAKKRTIREYWELCVERDTYREEYARHWSATARSGQKEVDVIICPSTPGAAPLHETARYWPYSSQWNLLDYPAAIFPVTFVDVAKDLKDPGYRPRNAQDQYNYDLYEPAKWEGAPVSCCIVGRRYMDEKVMAALEQVEKAMGRK